MLIFRRNNMQIERMVKMKKVLLVLLVCALAFSVAACGNGATTAPGGESHLIVAIPSFPVTLDNTATNETNSLMIHHNIVETLVRFDGPNFNIVPGLAESWDMVDPQTIVMNLRQGVLFHNGDEMRASDVQFSLMRGVASPQTGFIHRQIESVDIIDDFTVQINLNIPFAPALAHLTHPGAAINSQRAVEEAGDAFGDNPVGTGPFMFSSMSLGDYVEIVRFEDYWGERPGVDRITYRIIPEVTSRLIAVETGEAHIAFEISPHDIPRLQEDPNLAYDISSIPRFHFVGFNMQTTNATQIHDPRVREAINLAIDVYAIVETVYQGLGQVTHGPLVAIPGVINFPGHEVNLERARQLMAEAGYEDGFTLSLWNNADNQECVDKAVIIQNMLAQIGITVEIVSVEFATFLAGATAGEQDMHVLHWNNITADPDYGLALWHSTNIGASNRFRYDNPEVDRLLDLGRSELDPAARTEIYNEVQRLIVADMPAIFLLHGEELVALSPNVEGFVNFPSRIPELHTVRLTG